MSIKFFRFWFITLSFSFCALSLYALDVNLWHLPLPPQSSAIWEDKPLEVNGINANATRIYSQLEVEEALDFYKDFLLSNGWQVKDHFKDQHVTVFIKEERFMYVAGRAHTKERAPCDIYVVSSPADLALCKILANHMSGQEGSLMSQDAAGKDISDIPRYPRSKRMISIFAPEQGSILIYQAIANPVQIADFFQRNLKITGWQLVQPLMPEFLKKRIPDMVDNVRVLLFKRENETLFVNAYLLPEEVTKQEITMVTIVKNMLNEFAGPYRIKEQ